MRVAMLLLLASALAIADEKPQESLIPTWSNGGTDREDVTINKRKYKPGNPLKLTPLAGGNKAEGGRVVIGGRLVRKMGWSLGDAGKVPERDETVYAHLYVVSTAGSPWRWRAASAS